MYNYMVDQLENFKLHIQPQAVPDPFQGITLVFRKMIYEQDQTMYNYIVAKIQNFMLQIQYMVNTLHERNILHLNKVHERNQKMLQNFKLQIQPQAVPVSYISLSKVPSQKIFVSAETKPYKSDHLTKLAHFRQLISLPWKIVTTSCLDGVAEDKISTIAQSTSEDRIHKSETSHLRNPIQMIKVDSYQQLNISK